MRGGGMRGRYKKVEPSVLLEIDPGGLGALKEGGDRTIP